MRLQLKKSTVGRSRLSASPWRSDMVRTSDLAVRVSDAQYRDTFRLPIDAARRKARDVIGQNPRDGLTPTVENWRQLPTVRLNSEYGTFPPRIDDPPVCRAGAEVRETIAPAGCHDLK